jgi:hypothetical protein
MIKIKGTETPVVLVANKCDMLTARCVTEDDGASLAAQLDCPKFDISVADGYQGVSDAMEELLIQIKRDFMSMQNTMPWIEPTYDYIQYIHDWIAVQVRSEYIIDCYYYYMVSRILWYRVFTCKRFVIIVFRYTIGLCS